MTSTLAMGITANLRRVPADSSSTIFVDCFLNPLFVTHESATLASQKPNHSHPIRSSSSSSQTTQDLQIWEMELVSHLSLFQIRLCWKTAVATTPNYAISCEFTFFETHHHQHHHPRKMQITNCDKACTVCDFLVVFFFFKFWWNLSTDRSLIPLTIEQKLSSTDDWKNPSPAPPKTVERNWKQSWIQKKKRTHIHSQQRVPKKKKKKKKKNKTQKKKATYHRKQTDLQTQQLLKKIAMQLHDSHAIATATKRNFVASASAKAPSPLSLPALSKRGSREGLFQRGICHCCFCPITSGACSAPHWRILWAHP